MKKTGLSASTFRVGFLRRSREFGRRYRESRPWIKQLHTQFLGLRPGMRIVDVGCGTGDLTKYLASLIPGKCQIIGLDTKTSSLKVAVSETRRAGLSRKISYRKGDVYNTPLEDEYADLTCCRTLLSHLQDPLRAVREMTRITKKRGLVAAMELGNVNSFYDPENEEFTELSYEMNRALSKGVRKLEGKDFQIGDRLPSIFLKAGLQEIKAEVLAGANLYCDARRRPQDFKEELRFWLQTFRERKRGLRRAYLAGGAAKERIREYFRRREERDLRLLSDDKELRNNATFGVWATYIVTGRRRR